MLWFWSSYLPGRNPMTTHGPAARVVCLGCFVLQESHLLLLAFRWVARGPLRGLSTSDAAKHSCALRSLMYVCNRTTPRQRDPSSPAAAHLSRSRKYPLIPKNPVPSAGGGCPVRSQARGGLDLADSCSWLSAPWRDPISGYALARLSCHETLFLPNDDPGILTSATTASPISRAPAGGSWPAGPRSSLLGRTPRFPSRRPAPGKRYGPPPFYANVGWTCFFLRPPRLLCLLLPGPLVGGRTNFLVKVRCSGTQLRARSA